MAPKQTPKPFIDYSHEVKLINYRPLRYLLVSLSCVFLVIGIIGIFLPLLPTTPFVLLSAALYARSSSRFYNWLMNHPMMGPSLRHWKEEGKIALKSKIIAVSLIVLTMGPAVIFFIPLMAVKVGVALVGIGVSIFIITRPH